MRPGRVTTIRVNPRDCMSIVDTVDKLGLYSPGMSFAQAVSIALASAMESFRKHEIVPNRTGFEYSQMMEKYPSDNTVTRGRKLAITEAISLHKESVQVPAAVPGQSTFAKEERLAFLVETSNTRELTPEEDMEFIKLNKEIFHE